MVCAMMKISAKKTNNAITFIPINNFQGKFSGHIFEIIASHLTISIKIRVDSMGKFASRWVGMSVPKYKFVTWASTMKISFSLYF